MRLDFKPISIKDIDIYRSFPARGTNSKFSFVQGWMWRNTYALNIAVLDEGLLFTACQPGKTPAFVSPIIKDEKAITTLVPHMLQYAGDVGMPFRMEYVCDEIKELLQKYYPDTFDFTYDRDNSEYVYLTQELATLSGKKLHQKRNHINAFCARHSYTFRQYTAADFDGCMALQKHWCALKNEENCGETEAVEAVLRNYEALRIRAGVIEQDGEITAFSIGEKINDECAVILIEKADERYNGLYQLINKEMAKLFCDTVYINRCEDMGIDGLRQAKLSYKPCHMVDKYICTLKGQFNDIN